MLVTSKDDEQIKWQREVIRDEWLEKVENWAKAINDTWLEREDNKWDSSED